jgi:Uma2 family endonuclease
MTDTLTPPVVRRGAAAGRELTAEDLAAMLGPVPLSRIRTSPAPGTATMEDALALDAEGGLPVELWDGVLVEKPMGIRESRIAHVLGGLLFVHLLPNDIGMCLTTDGGVRVSAEQLRYPDLSFFLWDRLPNRELPPGPFMTVAPDLAVEVLSPGNTRQEMDRKRREYFAMGTRLVWMIDPQARTAEVFDAPDRGRTLGENDALDGGEVLPGFSVALKTLFDAGRPRG